MVRRIRWCLLLMLLASCQRGEGREHEVLHPTPDNIPEITDPRFTVDDEPQDTLLWVLAALRGGHTVGVAEGSADDMIGHIWDVAVSDNLIYYVDWTNSHVRAYDVEGALVDIIGAPGDGPGEFRFVTRVAVSGKGDSVNVVVGSSIGTKVSVFSKTLSGAHMFRKSFRPAVRSSGSDLCTMHGYAYTTGYSETVDGIIHKHSLEGEYVSSFGVHYKHPDPFIRHQMGRGGSLECNATHRTLLYVAPHAAIATAFAESGDMLWRIKFTDARIARKKEMISADGLSSVMNLQPGVGESQDFRILQGAHGDSFWLRRSERISEDHTRLVDHLYKVDVTSGKGKHLGIRPIDLSSTKEYSRLIHAVDDSHIYTTLSAPYPQLGIHPIPNSKQ